MGTLPIPKLLVSMSVPIMASMLIQALYNVVDSIFVAKISEDALTAVSLAFPVQVMMIAVAVGTAIGINALLSRRLGEKNYDEANLVTANGIFLSILSALAFALFGIFGLKAFFSAFVGPGAVMEMGMAYTSIVSIVSFGIFLAITGERLLQATGITIYSMYSQMAGAITNIILDPILIFGLLGAPKMGVSGAAVATVAGQIVSCILVTVFNITKNHEISLSMKNFRPDWRIIVEIYKVGLPSIFMQTIGAVMTFGMNKILIMFSATAVSVFGIYFKLQSFVFMPVFGLTSGMIPIVGFNYGARHRERIVHTIKLASLMALGITAVGFAIFQIFPTQILGTLFDASDTMLAIGVPALRIISLHFLLAAISIILSSAFQALGKGMYSLMMSVSRQLVVLLPTAYFLGKFISLNAVWLSFPIAEVVSVILALVLYRRLYEKEIKPM
ncbi:MATE family efflux transporter [Oscillospiraceae bacterium MB24-C1]|nr:MATE family efflux transporter [Oscillospiraceae bacterium MB24-C1]